MKLSELNAHQFQKYDDILVDVENLYFNHADKDIYSILKNNVAEPHFLFTLVKIKPSSTSRFFKYQNLDDFNYEEQEKIQDSYYHFFFSLLNSVSDLEKETLLDLALGQNNPRITTLLLKNPEIKLTSQQFERIFNGQHRMIKEALVSNTHINLTVEQINQGLLGHDFGLNLVYAKRQDKNILKETIDTLIANDDMESYFNEEVLIEIFSNPHIHFDKSQVNFVMNGDNFKLKVAIAKNHSIHFTESDIIQGLNDEGFEYEAYDSTYDDYDPSDVVVAFLENPNISIPASEINRFIFQSNDYYIKKLIARGDIDFTSPQIDEVLSLNNQSSLLMLKQAQLNDHQLLKLLYQKPYWPEHIAQAYLSRTDVHVSDSVYNILKTFDNEDIQTIVQTRGDNLLKSEGLGFKNN